MSTRQYFFVVTVVVFCLLTSFYSGYFLKDLLLKSGDKNSVSDSNLKPYFSDEIILVTKEEPHLTLIAYASRSSADNSIYSHRQKVFFFDGKEWQSESTNSSSNKSDIVKTKILPRWDINFNPSLVLKQSVNGEAQINNNRIEFDVPVLNNELGIRSLANYTIFRSEASGKLIFNGKEYESYVLYSRTYSYNVSINLVEINEPLGINTDWIAFWDSDGNFYNIDKNE